MNDSIPIQEKYTLNIPEAAAYYGIGEKKLRQICADHPRETFYLLVGNKLLIKKNLFEDFLSRTTTV